MNSLGKISLYTLIGNQDMQHNLENHKFIYGNNFTNFRNAYDSLMEQSTYYVNQTEYSNKEWRNQAKLAATPGVRWPKTPDQN